MQLDDMQRIWSGRGGALAAGAALNLRHGARPPRPRRPLFVYVLRSGLEAALLLLAAGLVVPVLLVHPGDLRYSIPGGAVLAYLVGLPVLWLRLAARAVAIDFDQPIAAVQQRLGDLRLRECHAVKWALFGGIVVWLPLPLLLVEAGTGAPLLAAVDGTWLVANLLFGLGALECGRRWARRHLHAAGLQPLAAALVTALGDRSLRRAQQQLDELAAFTADPDRVADPGPGSE